MSPSALCHIRRWGLLALFALFAACAAPPEKPAEPTPVAKEETKPPAPEPPRSDEQALKELAGGIAAYENGKYKAASGQLQKALSMGLNARDDRIKAHKYLAFIHCVGGRKKLCANEFRTILDAKPDFELTSAEAGHPTWGPVFRQVKKSHKPVKQDAVPPR